MVESKREMEGKRGGETETGKGARGEKGKLALMMRRGLRFLAKAKEFLNIKSLCYITEKRRVS